MRLYARFELLIIVIAFAVGGILSGCFSSTREVDTVPAPAIVQLPPPIVQVPAAVVVAPASETSHTTTSTSWGNGAVEQNRTTRSVDGQLQNQTTTTWNNGDPTSATSTTTTTSP